MVSCFTISVVSWEPRAASVVLENSKTLEMCPALSRKFKGKESGGQFKPLAIKNKAQFVFHITLNDTFLLKAREEVSVWAWCLLRGKPARRGKLPHRLQPRFLLCFYNLWLEAVLHSILSSVAVAAVQWGSRNNCVPCRGCLNCWNKLLSHPTSHLQHVRTHTHICMQAPTPSASLLLPPAQTTPCGGLSVTDAEEHAIYLGNNHFTRHHTYRQCTVKSPGSSGASWAAPVFSFVPPPNWYWMVPQRDTAFITVGATLNHSLDRIGSRDLSQQLQPHSICCTSFH